MLNNTSAESASHASGSSIGLIIAATGVVYGDIGTSPLYTLKEVFSGHYGVEVNHDGVLGILSLILWSLIWVVSLKYVVFMLRADNEGEGGVMALTALVQRATASKPKLSAALVLLGLFGAALFYGDSMITPAISVLSAVEGLEVALPNLEPWIIPITVMLLIGLFMLQKHGTARIGVLFGPIMLIWFVVLGLLGIYRIAENPEVFLAINPGWAIDFFASHPGIGITILAAVVLALTGAEALYVDMGHFGRSPITKAWFVLVLPGLVLNYFGQGALILSDPEAARNPFYLLAPSWALFPMIILSTLATIIASQAVISGAFSLTQQAMQLGYVPRMLIQHTSSASRGQIYVGSVNWTLMICVILLVIGFGSSGALATAYGVAVTTTMLIDTLLVSSVVLILWKAPRRLAIPLLLAFLVVDSLFFLANAPKILQGGIFPVIVGIVLFVLMTTWKTGKKILFQRLDDTSLSLQAFLESIRREPPHRVKGTAVFLCARSDAVPHALLHNLMHNQVLHEQVVLLTAITSDKPRVDSAQRVEIACYGDGFYRVLLNFGFMEEANIPKALLLCERYGLKCPPMQTTYFLSRETIIPKKGFGMAPWRESLFAFLQKSANSSMRYFCLPANRVIELGTQVEI